MILKSSLFYEYCSIFDEEMLELLYISQYGNFDDEVIKFIKSYSFSINTNSPYSARVNFLSYMDQLYMLLINEKVYLECVRDLPLFALEFAEQTEPMCEAFIGYVIGGWSFDEIVKSFKPNISKDFIDKQRKRAKLLHPRKSV